MSRLIPFIHPALMSATLALGLFLLVIGLRIRKQRRQGPGPGTVRLAAMHMRALVSAMLLFIWRLQCSWRREERLGGRG